MGERCFLNVHNEHEPIGAGSRVDYAVGMAFEVDFDRIPPLWLALFAESDLKTVIVPEHYLEDFTPKVTIPALHATKTAALELFDRRMPAIQNHVHPAIWLYLELFRDAVAACEYDYIEIELYGLWRQFEKSANNVSDYIHRHLHAFESDESWSIVYGDNTIVDTSELYGLAFDGVSSFETGIDLPWVKYEETYTSGKPRRNALPIDDKFILTYDAAGETALRFAICFKSVWDGIKQGTKEFLLNHWKDIEYVTIRGAKGECGPAQRIFSPGRPVLGLLTGIPETLGLSFAVDNGRGLIWNARTVRGMNDNALHALIAELIVRTRLQIDLLSDEFMRNSTQTETGVDIDSLMKWIQGNRPFARRCITPR